MFLERVLREEREEREARRVAVEREATHIYRRTRAELDPALMLATIAPTTPALPHPRATRLRRGVYLSPFLSRTGNDVWFAVDSNHRCRKSLEVTQERPEWLCRRVLAALLDQIDPVPQLRAI